MHHTASYQPCDTAVLIADEKSEITTAVLPLPLLPILSNGEMLSMKEIDPLASEILSKQPFMLRENPRSLDFVLLDTENLANAPELLSECGGVVADLEVLPAMNSEEIDGFIVAIRTLLGVDKPVAFVNGISRVESLHVRSSHHNLSLIHI